MQANVKSGIEYAVISLLVAGLCLWQLISTAHQDEPPAGQLVLLSLGLAVAIAMHFAFMLQLVRRTGRALFPWLIAIVLVPPIGTAVLLALLLSEADSAPG